MAAEDLIAVTVPTTGNRIILTFESMAVGGTWNLGPWTNNSPTGATVVMTVQCPGYDGAGASDPKTRTIYGVPHQKSLAGAGHGVMRKAWVGSGDPVPDETDSGGNIVATIFLSGVLHATDVITNLQISAGLYNDGSNDNNAYNADPAGILTFSTTRTYPLPVFSWDSVDGTIFGDLVGADFKMAAWARSLYGIAAVRYTITDASTNELDVYVTTQTQRQRANGEFVFNYLSDLLDVNTFVQGDALKLRARVYPAIGDVVFDTDDHTTALLVGQGRNTGAAICNKTGELTVKRYVAASGGDNGNDGLTPSTPWDTIVYAVQQNANEIRLLAGDHTGSVDPGTRKVNAHWFRILPAEGESAATVSMLVPANHTTDLFLLQFEDITLKATATQVRYVGSGEDLLRCKRVVFDRNGQADSSSTYGFNTFPWCSFEECSGDVGAKWNFQSPGTTAGMRFDGTDLTTVTAGTSVVFQFATLFAGCNMTACGFSHGAAEFSHENIMVQNTAIWAFNDASAVPVAFKSWDVEGIWMENVLVESLNNAPPAMELAIQKGAEHVVLRNCLVWGQRSLCFYNYTGTSNAQGAHTSTAQSYFDYLATKHDDFGTQDAARVGHWEFMMATESGRDHVWEDTFRRQFSGVLTTQDDDSVPPTVAFVDDASNVSRHGDGSGNGDYRDANTTTNRRSYSPAAWENMTPYDRTGRSRGTNGASAGGYVYLGPDLPVPDPPTTLAQS